MAGILFTSGRFSATDSAGNPLVGGTVTSYAGGTSTLKATYADAALATPNANPVTLDANGSAPIFFGPGLYKIVVADSAGVVRYTTDNVAGSDAYISAAPAADQTIAGHKLAVPTGIDGPLGTVTPASVTATDVTVNANASSLVRITDFTALGQGLSVNLRSDGTTRDTAGRFGGGYFVDSINGGYKARMINPAGSAKDYAFRLTAGCDYGPHNNTGNTTVNTMFSRTVLGQTLGANGGFRVRCYLNVLAQGVTPSKVSLAANGIQIAIFSVTASVTGVYVWEVIVGNRAATNAQVCYALPTYYGASPAVLPATVTTPAVDTTADVVFDLRLQGGANSDSVTIDVIEIELINTFAM